VGGPTVGLIIIAGMVARGSSVLATALQSKHAVSSKSSMSVKDRSIAVLVGMNLKAGDASTKQRLHCIVHLLQNDFSADLLRGYLN
jgi:hypothetical protein